MKRWWHLFPVPLTVVGRAMKNAPPMTGFCVLLFSLWVVIGSYCGSCCYLGHIGKKTAGQVIQAKWGEESSLHPSQARYTGINLASLAFSQCSVLRTEHFLLLRALLWFHLGCSPCWKIFQQRLPTNVNLLSFVCQVQFLIKNNSFPRCKYYAHYDKALFDDTLMEMVHSSQINTRELLEI